MQSFASQHTQSFAEFLRQAGVSLVVSTYQAGQLVLVRPQGQGANTHFIPMKKPMGIAVEGGQRLTIGDAHRIDFYRNLSAVGRKIDQGQYDAAYLFRATHVTGDIDIHEMGYDSESQLWLINTRMSCLCTLSEDASVVPRWKPPFISQYDLLDRCHLNGLGFRDGRPRYVSMLGASDEPGGWRRNKTSGGRIMDITDDSVVVEGLCMPHSPRWYRERIWFLSSGEGALKRVETDGSVTTVAELPGFTRGLDFFGRYALIGLSQVRETAVFAGLPLTQRVDERQCGVYLVDIEEGKIVGFLHFIGDVREIFDIKILPHRAPALVEASAPLLTTSYELPEDALKLVAPGDPIQDALAAATRAHAGGELDKAIAAYQDILAQKPDHRQAKHQLGLALVDAERWQEGHRVLSEVIAEQPDNAEALNSLGLCASRLLNYQEALGHFERAIEIDRQFALAHFNRGLILLKSNRYQEGWPEYEWRWQLPSFTPFRCPHPQWRGEDIADKRLLVHSEQGNGDHIQFWRYLPLLRERCKELIYVGPEKLSELVSSIPGVDESRVPGNIPRDRFDCFVPLMNVPHLLGLHDPKPMLEPYVKVPAHLQVRRLEGQRKIGLVWQGSPTHKDDRRRSLNLQALLPTLQGIKADFYSLQFPISGEEIELLKRHGVHNLEPEINGYSRTAAFVEQLDAVISVDTAMAHLAGAMGKPVYLLLAKDADWRWGLDGDQTPWYPSTRLLRQTEPGDWGPVLNDLAQQLRLR
ncbi:TIGR03032 family protein [Pseudomarimonas arenosa]|uniref:TIGR03032 family protein n=1 Tax=Pseudomarimonas arenosa TaxID=2774145 RepID=A0AAW3ZG36_9GAMM|nr:TIGR03032 family protein [Pseudomarimonas arenosa]MBD8524828.1 TIGR03032 family protein [Pseudomarimonas arenosa]